MEFNQESHWYTLKEPSVQSEEDFTLRWKIIETTLLIIRLMKRSFPASLSDKATLTHFFPLGEYLYYIRMLSKLSIKIQCFLCVLGNWEKALARLVKWQVGKWLYVQNTPPGLSLLGLTEDLLTSSGNSTNKKIHINACFLVEEAQGQKNFYNTPRRQRAEIL